MLTDFIVKIGIALTLYPWVMKQMQQKTRKQALPGTKLSWVPWNFVCRQFCHARNGYSQKQGTHPQRQRVRRRQKSGYCTTTIGKSLHCCRRHRLMDFSRPWHCTGLTCVWVLRNLACWPLAVLYTQSASLHTWAPWQTANFLWKGYCVDLSAPN